MGEQEPDGGLTPEQYRESEGLNQEQATPFGEILEYLGRQDKVQEEVKDLDRDGLELLVAETRSNLGHLSAIWSEINQSAFRIIERRNEKILPSFQALTVVHNRVRDEVYEKAQEYREHKITMKVFSDYLAEVTNKFEYILGKIKELEE